MSYHSNNNTIVLSSQAKEKYKRKNKDLEDSKIAYKIVYTPNSSSISKELSEQDFFSHFQKQFPDVAAMLLNPDEKITKEMIDDARKRD